MKKQVKNKIRLHFTLLYLIIFVILITFFNVNGNIIFKNEKNILKNISESTPETDLEKTIEELNTSHTEYANYVQECKQKISNAITNKGITTNIDDTVDTIVGNIENIQTGPESFSITLTANNGWDQSGAAGFSMDVSEYSSFEITKIDNIGVMNATGNFITLDGENIGKPSPGMKVSLEGKSNIVIYIFAYSNSTYQDLTAHITFYK